MANSSRDPGRPARLDRDRIVAAALECDLRTASMRDVAAALGVSHSALYRWVAGRDELLALIGSVLVVKAIPEREAGPDDWREWLTDLAWRLHDEFGAVPGLAGLVVRPHRHDAEAFGRLRESVVHAFEAAGCAPEDAEASWAVFVLGVVQWSALDEGGPDHAPPVDFGLYLGVLLRGLPVDAADLRGQRRTGSTRESTQLTAPTTTAPTTAATRPPTS